MDFALYHLVQISNQRWDKFKFEGFPLLAENLMAKALDISLVTTGVKWELQYDVLQLSDRVNELNSLHGTRDLLEKIKQMPVTLPEDTSRRTNSTTFCATLKKRPWYYAIWSF